MQPTILQVNVLAVDQATSGAGTIVPAIIGSNTGNTPFSYNLPIGKKIYWELYGLFTLGATGGFRFVANNAGTESNYIAQWVAEENTTPATIRANQTAQADFANASAVAATYALKAFGEVVNNTPGGVFSLQFAQNTADVLPITLKAGMMFKLYIL